MAIWQQKNDETQESWVRSKLWREMCFVTVPDFFLWFFHSSPVKTLGPSPVSSSPLLLDIAIATAQVSHSFPSTANSGHTPPDCWSLSPLACLTPWMFFHFTSKSLPSLLPFSFSCLSTPAFINFIFK